MKLIISIPATEECQLEETIQCCLNQSFSDFMIVVCGAVPSGEARKSGKDDRIRYVPGDRLRSVPECLNACLFQGPSEYLCILHPGDLMLPDNLAHKIDILDQNSGIGWVHSDVRIHPQCVTEEELSCSQPIISEHADIDLFKRWILQKELRVVTSSVLFRRSVATQTGTFEEGLFHSELNFWLRAASFGGVAYIQEPLVECRLKPQEIEPPSWLLREDYEARKRAVEMVQEDQPDWHRSGSLKNLSSTLASSYASRALELADVNLTAGDRKETRRMLLVAAGIQPHLRMTPRWLRLFFKSG